MNRDEPPVIRLDQGPSAETPDWSRVNARRLTQDSVSGQKVRVQRRRFNMTVAKHHVDLAMMTRSKPSSPDVLQITSHEKDSAPKALANRHHFAWICHFRFANGRK